MKKFTSTTWRLLDERLQMVLVGAVPPWTRKRTFFYKCRLEFQQEWNLPEIDVGGANPYSSWGTSVNNWALKHCADLGIKEGRFWEVLGRLNIWPHERGICFRNFGGLLQKTMVNHETKEKIKEDCSFIIVSEKETLCQELWEVLNDSGYRGTIIAMGGHNTGTVQSIAAEVSDELQRIEAENFYILSLHDYDLDGVVMMMNLRGWFPWVIDGGINRNFLEFNKIDKDHLIRETVINRKDVIELREFVGIVPEYDETDIAMLHGEKVGSKKWVGKRIEIDSVYAKYGIKPFVDYIKDQMKDVPCWDLTRIGIEEQELEEGNNLFDEVRNDFNTKVGMAYGEKSVELSQTATWIREVVKDNLRLPIGFSRLKDRHVEETGETGFLRYSDEDMEKYWTYNKLNVKKVDEVYDQYETDKDYKTEYQERLDEEVNKKLKCWKGDVSTAAEDIKKKVDDLQGDLDHDKEHDRDLEMFREELDKVDWGEKELEQVDPADPIEEIDRVIEALERLKQDLRGGGET